VVVVVITLVSNGKVGTERSGIGIYSSGGI